MYNDLILTKQIQDNRKLELALYVHQYQERKQNVYVNDFYYLYYLDQQLCNIVQDIYPN